jgi:hypothetical protein
VTISTLMAAVFTEGGENKLEICLQYLALTGCKIRNSQDHLCHTFLYGIQNHLMLCYISLACMFFLLFPHNQVTHSWQMEGKSWPRV